MTGIFCPGGQTRRTGLNRAAAAGDILRADNHVNSNNICHWSDNFGFTLIQPDRKIGIISGWLRFGVADNGWGTAAAQLCWSFCMFSSGLHIFLIKLGFWHGICFIVGI